MPLLKAHAETFEHCKATVQHLKEIIPLDEPNPIYREIIAKEKLLAGQAIRKLQGLDPFFDEYLETTMQYRISRMFNHPKKKAKLAKRVIREYLEAHLELPDRLIDLLMNAPGFVHLLTHSLLSQNEVVLSNSSLKQAFITDEPVDPNLSLVFPDTSGLVFRKHKFKNIKSTISLLKSLSQKINIDPYYRILPAVSTEFSPNQNFQHDFRIDPFLYEKISDRDFVSYINLTKMFNQMGVGKKNNQKEVYTPTKDARILAELALLGSRLLDQKRAPPIFLTFDKGILRPFDELLQGLAQNDSVQVQEMDSLRVKKLHLRSLKIITTSPVVSEIILLFGQP